MKKKEKLKNNVVSPRQLEPIFEEFVSDNGSSVFTNSTSKLKATINKNVTGLFHQDYRVDSDVKDGGTLVKYVYGPTIYA